MSCLLFLEEARGHPAELDGLFSELLAEVLAQSVDDTGHHFNRLAELVRVINVRSGSLSACFSFSLILL